MENDSRSHSPQLDAIASQMDAHSAELLHHISVAMTQLPAAPGTTAKEQATQALAQPHSSGIDDSVMSQRHSSSPMRSRGYIQNPLFVKSSATSKLGTGLEGHMSPFSDLISRIRLTECRLQEAITSLTDATHRFKEEMPNDPANGCAHHPLGTQPAMQLPHDGPESCQSPQLRPWTDSSACPKSGTVASPLRSLEWTQLNPLYPASSRSTSPASQVTSHPASRTHSPTPLEGNRHIPRHMVNFSPAPSECIVQPCMGQYRAEQSYVARERAPVGHSPCPAPSPQHGVQKASEYPQRQVAADSMVSVSSAWSLEQPPSQDDIHSMNKQSIMKSSMATNIQPCGIRATYSTSTNTTGTFEKLHTFGTRSARPAAVSAGHATFESPTRTDDGADSECHQESASLPDWSHATPGET